ncbi:hypothetical protein SB766_02290 [Pseudomonas sp. SIMBA_077]
MASNAVSDADDAHSMQRIDPQALAQHLWPLLERYDVKNRGYGLIYVDHEYYNIDTANKILMGLSASLDVPVALVRARLLDLGWLNDVRSTLPGRNDAARIVDEQKVFNEYALNEAELNEQYRED